MLYVKHDHGRYLRYHANKHHRVIHYWYHPKPWVLSASGVPEMSMPDLHYHYNYLQRSDMTNESLYLGLSPCAHKLRMARRAIESDVRFLQLDDKYKTKTPPWFPLWRRV